MRDFFSYFASRKFLINIVLILLLVAGIFYGAMKWLESFTNHGEYVVVPDFTGRRVTQLDDFVQSTAVSYQIVDSIYDPAEKPGIVLRQDPDPESKVKHNRTVYLYVTGMVPPQIEMPKLLDRSERQAKLIVETYGLKVGRVTEKEADCDGCVLAQEHRGREIAPGDKVKKGSVIDLVIGRKDAFIGEHDRDTTSTEPEF